MYIIVTCSIEGVICNLQLATRNLQLATRNLQLATRRLLRLAAIFDEFDRFKVLAWFTSFIFVEYENL